MKRKRTNLKKYLKKRKDFEDITLKILGTKYLTSKILCKYFNKLNNENSTRIYIEKNRTSM